jgi:polysaccharide export outer membrane protein
MSLWQLALLLVIGTVAPRASAAPPTTADYRFAAGDVIEVTVSPQHNFDRVVTVQPDGKVSYPIVGQVEAAGLTVQQLVAKIQEGLNRDLVDPVVTISLKEAGRGEVKRVSLLGAVHTAGTYEIRDGTTLTEVLAAAGGAGVDADLRRVTISRTDGSTTTVDLSQTEKTGQVDRRVILQAGDIIIVPQGPRPTVLVLGEVNKPGSQELQRDARLLDVIAAAGGLTEKADLHRVTLTRAGANAPQPLDLQPLLAKGDTSQSDLNVLMQPGDALFIPASAQQIYVLGAVIKPGQYPIKPNDRVLDALVTAGGAGPAARKAALVRYDSQGKPVRRDLDLKKIMAHGDLAENELLRAGDVLYVSDNHANRRATTEAILDNVLKVAALFVLF